MNYEVRIPDFEGPLDVLLHLIEKNEIDIYDIPIALITEQYLEYLAGAGELDLELTSEFLLMACTLLSIKVKMLLPKHQKAEEEEIEEDPRQALVEKLLEYKQYKEKAAEFKNMETAQAVAFWREVDEVKLLSEFPSANPLGSVSLQDMLEAYYHVLRKAERKKEVISIDREEITIQEKIREIVTVLEERPGGVVFYELFSSAGRPDEVVVTFLALLELARRGVVMLRQSGLFADIIVFLRTEEGERTSAHFVS